MANYSKVLAAIEAVTDPQKLRNFIANAKREGVEEVESAAFNRLLYVLHEAVPGSIEHDFWKAIHAVEELLTQEKGKTMRLSRIRQKANRVGVIKTLADLCYAKKPSERFTMLVDYGLPEWSAEAIVLKHRNFFEPEILDATENRLIEADVDIYAL